MSLRPPPRPAGKGALAGAAGGRRAAFRRRSTAHAAAGYRYSSAHLMIASLLGRSRQWRASMWRRAVAVALRGDLAALAFGAGFAVSGVAAAAFSPGACAQTGSMRAG